MKLNFYQISMRSFSHTNTKMKNIWLTLIFLASHFSKAATSTAASFSSPEHQSFLETKAPVWDSDDYD